MNKVPNSAEGIAVAVDALRRGQVVAYPTETFYGLAVDPFSVEALEALYRLKDRDPEKPISLLIGAYEQLHAVVRDVSVQAERVARAFWPGPLSLLLPRAPELPRELCKGRNLVSVRWSPAPAACALSLGFGAAITATSANVAAEAPACELNAIGIDGIAVGIDGGRLEGVSPSTVLNPDSGEIVRAGAVSREELEAFIED